MHTPLISVITPVGPRHTEHVKVAHASVHAQTVPSAWWEHLIGYDTDRRGPARIRNELIARAKGTFILCLDADDYLLPTAMTTYLHGMAHTTRAYVYADNYAMDASGQAFPSASADYDRESRTHPNHAQGVYNKHVVTALIPTALVREVGGFDERVDIWEDWTLWLRCAIRGWCGERIPRATLVYRLTEGDRMQPNLANYASVKTVQELYANSKGEIIMCGCNQPNEAKIAAEQARSAVQVLSFGLNADTDSGLVRMSYNGSQGGSFYVQAPSGTRYKLGGRRQLDAEPVDVPFLESYGCGKVERVVFTPPPPPMEVSSDVPDVITLPIPSDAVLDDEVLNPIITYPTTMYSLTRGLVAVPSPDASLNDGIPDPLFPDPAIPFSFEPPKPGDKPKRMRTKPKGDAV